MIGDPKKMAALILAEKKGEESEPEGEVEEGPPDALETAAEELVEAVGSKDKKAVAAALRNAFEICGAQSSDGDAE